MSLLTNKFFKITISLFVIIIVTIITYYPVVNNDFIAMDDAYYVTDNDLVKELSDENFFSFFHTKVAGNIQPLTMLSLSIDYHFFKLDPSAYHIHNVIVHILNALLVFLFIFILSKKKIFLAFLTSLIFAIHPLHVESVAWISERKDVLYTFYFIAGLISYLYYKRLKNPNFLVYTYVLFALSLLSKPTAVSFPIVLIILDFYFEGKFSLKQFYSKWLMFVLSLIFGLINLKSQGVTSTLHVDFEIYKKIIYSSYNIVFYIRSFFFPTELSMYREIPAKIPVFYYFSTLIVFATGIFTVYSILKKKYKLIIFGFLFFLSTIFLTLHIVAFSTAIVAERYTYIPYIGLSYPFLLLVFYSKDGSFKHIFNKVYLTWVFSFLIISIFSYISFTYIKNDCKNSETLWTNSIKKYSGSRVAYDARSNYYFRKDKPEMAIKDIRASQKLLPNGDYSNLSLAYYYYYVDNYDSVFIVSKKTNAKFKGEYTKLRAMTYYKMKDYENSLLCYDTLITSKPNNFEFRKKRAELNLKTGLYPEAIEDLCFALSIKPNCEECKLKIGNAYFKLKKYKKAISYFESVKKSELRDSNFEQKLNKTYLLLNDTSQINN